MKCFTCGEEVVNNRCGCYPTPPRPEPAAPDVMYKNGSGLRIEKPSQLLAVVGWISVFVQGWLILLRFIPSDFLTWLFFVIFFFVAVMASAVASGKPALNASSLEVNVGGKIYNQKNGGIVVGNLKNGRYVIWVNINLENKLTKQDIKAAQGKGPAK